MKTKPLLFIAACIILLTAGLLLLLKRGNAAKPDKADISKFLYSLATA